MGEYWNQFLNWLNVVGSRFAGMDYPGNRIAPKAEDRYANSELFEGSISGFPTSHSIQGVRLILSGNGGLSSLMSREQRPARIYSYINEPGDTVITEQPESSLKWNMFDYYYPRTASTKNRKGNTYKILSNRLKIAKKLAKKSKQ